MKQSIQRFFDYMRSIFFNGLLTILPIALTIGFMHFLIRLLKKTLIPIHNMLPAILQDIPYSELVLSIIFIFLVGVIVKIFILKSLIHVAERALRRIPLIHTIYSGVKQIVHAFIGQDKLSFQQVVFVEFPRKGMYSIGFLTSELPTQIVASLPTQIYVNVFIPTTPNPTTGFFVVVPRTEVISVGLTRQEAMALVISGGIVQPDRFMH